MPRDASLSGSWTPDRWFNSSQTEIYISIFLNVVFFFYRRGKLQYDSCMQLSERLVYHRDPIEGSPETLEYHSTMASRCLWWTQLGPALSREAPPTQAAEVHTEIFFLNLIKSNINQIVFIIFRLIWIETDVRLDQNQSEKW